MPNLEIKNFVLDHSKKESFLYNNRLFFFYVNPTEKQKKEYEGNRLFIINYFS